jgi:hypothetical protein
MQIPNADRAIVEEAKTVHYLLNSAHPENGGKAAFFTSLGFSKAQWQVLANALRTICVSGTVMKSVESVHGSKYVADGLIQAPRTGGAPVRTVWIIDKGTVDPRLVTAYPQ